MDIPRLHACAHHNSGGGLVSKAIRWQTRSYWNHISVRVDGTIYESIEGVGVRKRTAREVAESHVSRREVIMPLRLITPATDDQVSGIIEFFESQIGKPYDYTMIARFISRENRESLGSQDKWFCSEIAFRAYDSVGISLLRDTSPWEVSPGLFVRSPLFVHEPEERWPVVFSRAA